MRLSTARKIQVAKLASKGLIGARRLVGRGAQARVQRRGLNWDLDLQEGIDLSIFLLGAFEPSTVDAYSRLVRPGATVLDIGANIGAHTLPLARLCGSAGRVIAFEPTRFAFEKLRRNVALNPEVATHVSCQQVMLVGAEGAVLEDAIYSSWPLDRQRGNELHAEHKGRLMSTQEASAETLDSALSRLDVARVDFIKLDVDGHEPDVLSGARSTIAGSRPPILMELAPYVFRADMSRFRFMLDFLWSLGYELTDIDSGRQLPRDIDQVIAVIPQDGGINVLGRPA